MNEQPTGPANRTHEGLNIPTDGFDGSRPFAMLSVKDPVYGDMLSITCHTPEDFINNWTRTQNVAHGERHTWAGNYFFHADGEAAVRFHDNSKAWFQNGMIHNEAGPAIVFKGVEAFCLNGTFVDRTKFDQYVMYMKQVRELAHPAGLIPTFPQPDEINIALNHSLTLYFDLNGNFFWYNTSGQIHHPSAPAVEKTTGMVEYWSYGVKNREAVGIFGRENAVLNEIREAVKKALDEADALPTFRFNSVEDLSKSDGWPTLTKMFRSAGDQLLGGETTEYVFDEFAARYGEYFERDFSPQMLENFGELIEDVWDYCGWTGDKSQPPAGADETAVFKRAFDGRGDEEQTLLGKIPQLDKVVIDVPTLEEVREELLEKVREHLRHTAPEVAAPAAPANADKVASGFVKRGVEPDVLKASRVNGGSVEDQIDPVPQVAKFEAIQAARKEREEHDAQEKPAQTPQDGTGWGVPLGMLAVAGLVGLIGKKAPGLKVDTVVEKIAHETVKV